MIPENNDEIAAIKNQLFILLIALIVVSGTLTIFPLPPGERANKDITELQRCRPRLPPTRWFSAPSWPVGTFGAKQPSYQAVLKRMASDRSGSVRRATAPKK